MSRFDISEDQISVLDLEQVTELLVHISEEMTMLAKTEYKLYQHRRKLELAANPQLAETDPEPQIKDAQIRTLITQPDLRTIIQRALSSGLDIASILKTVH